MDYLELLRKYTQHVVDCEGISFVDLGFSQTLSPEEKVELKKIENDVYAKVFGRRVDPA